jgi:hypothetical protein
VIERMCFKEEVAAITHCDMMLPAEGRGTTIEPGKDLSGVLTQIPFYRLTVRVDGPRNTASFAQVMLR